MKAVLVIHGTRGDVEPCTAVALQLQTRGHVVSMAVPPNLVDFVGSAGVRSVIAYGPDSQKQLEGDVFERPDALTAATAADWLRLGNPLTVLRKARSAATSGWTEMSRVLASLVEGADVIVSGTAYQEISANIAEYFRVPMAEIHYFPVRANSHVLPVRLPAGIVGPMWATGEWLHWRLLRPAEAAQRRELGLANAHHRTTRRIADAGTLEIQAYDPVFFPGLSAEWGGRRPLIGSLTLQLSTGNDDDVTSWIAAGKPPLYFGFGSMPIGNPAQLTAMVSEVCAELGERALICAGSSEFVQSTTDVKVKVVPSVNHAAVFPACRAVVHHGGAGTTAAGLRAGAPTLILWVAAEQPLWGKQVARLGVGRSRRFTKVTAENLLDDLQAILDSTTAARARDVAALMIPSSLSVAMAADLIERQAQRRIAL